MKNIQFSMHKIAMCWKNR